MLAIQTLKKIYGMGRLWVDQPNTSEDLMCWVDHQFSTLGIR